MDRPARGAMRRKIKSQTNLLLSPSIIKPYGLMRLQLISGASVNAKAASFLQP